MAYAYRLIQKGGIEALEQELDARNIKGMNIKVSQKELKKASYAIKEQTTDSILMCSLITLRDEFGFGGKRLQQFRDKFMENIDCLIDGYVTFEDMKKAIEEECDVKGLQIRWNESDQKVEGV